ncbi:MAG: hypothetical protein JO084_15505 [Bradyrhizobiaceae bacterium]|nr:hypothetical protein [Bradyrhizobiaceae bacterium]
MREPLPGNYMLLLLFAGVVLAFVLELFTACRRFLRGDETSDAKPDRRRLFRLALVGGAAALALAAAIIIGYSVNPGETELLLAWLRGNPHSLLLAGIVFCLVALVCGVKPRQPVLLFCLALPGLVLLPLLWMPLLWLPEIMNSKNVADAVFWGVIIFIFQPGVLILLIIAAGQSPLLRKAGANFNAGGLARLCLISFAYAYGLLTI